jgi:hypothetical protein
MQNHDTGNRRRALPVVVLAAVLIAAIDTAPAAAMVVSDSAVADFSAGDQGTCVITDEAGGAVMLAPTEDAEFAGVGVPPGWGGFRWCDQPCVSATCGATTVAGGVATLEGTLVRSDANYSPGRTLDFVATFAPAPYQHVGFGDTGDTCGAGITFGAPPFAVFSTGGAGASVFVLGDNGAGGFAIDAGSYCDNGTCLGAPHRYRIEWAASYTDFFVDEIRVCPSADPSCAHTDSSTAMTANMRPAASTITSGADLVVDWIRMGPYAPACTFTSRTFDAGTVSTSWNTLTTDGTVPPGTSLAIETRTGNAPVPDGTWSPFAPLSGAAVASPPGRYLQYRAVLASGDGDGSAVLRQVDIDYDVQTPTSTPLDTATATVTATNTATATPVDSPTATATDTPTPIEPTPTASHTMIPTATPTDTAVPTATATDAPSELASFVCYKSKPSHASPPFASGTTVSVTDQFGAATAALKPPSALCVPSTIGSDELLAAEQSADLQEYRITRTDRFSAVRNVTVQDRFGTLRVDLKKPLALQMPAAHGADGAPPVPTPGIDHFQCYLAAVAKGAPKFGAVSGVPFADAFGSRTVIVKKPTRLCVPADVDGHAIGAEAHTQHVMCYRIKQTTLPKFAPISPLFVNDELGILTVAARQMTELCVPATVSR